MDIGSSSIGCFSREVGYAYLLCGAVFLAVDRGWIFGTIRTGINGRIHFKEYVNEEMGTRDSWWYIFHEDMQDLEYLGDGWLS